MNEDALELEIIKGQSNLATRYHGHDKVKPAFWYAGDYKELILDKG